MNIIKKALNEILYLFVILRENHLPFII